MSRRDSNHQTADNRARVRSRYTEKRDLSRMRTIPAKNEQVDCYDDSINQRVAIYVRVSTGSERQTSSFELQKKYYEEFVTKHPNWTLVEIYADEGISGTSLKNRDAFNRMIEDCENGKIDLVITKCVSRFARNTKDFLDICRKLAALKPAVGVFFEMENMYSLKDDSELPLSLQASFAQEESHIKSRSQIKSGDIRNANGLFTTPILIGYNQDENGKLVINQEEAPTVKLIFYMYLCGYSISRIADTLMALGKKTMPGNTKWTHSSIVGILRNERYCGDVLTRKTVVESYLTHKVIKNNGLRVQNFYEDDHEAIISRDDYIATQHLLDYSCNGNVSILPELRVVPDGILKGFVTLHPRWSGFKDTDFLAASKSVYYEDEDWDGEDIEITAEAGDFDLRGFEITRSEFFDTIQKPFVSFSDNKIKFSSDCIKKFGKETLVEVLFHPLTNKLAVRPAKKGNRNAMTWAKSENGILQPREIPSSAFYSTVCGLVGWSTNNRYRVTGRFISKDSDNLFIFDMNEPETFLKPFMVSASEDGTVKPLATSGKHIKAVPERWAEGFGTEYYLHEQPEVRAVSDQEDWNIQDQGQIFETRERLNVTEPSELKAFIKSEIINGTETKGVTDNNG